MKETTFNRFIKQIELAGRRFIIAVLNRKKRETVTSFPLPLPDNPTILFLRQDRYGDAIISTPIIAAIAERYPQANLSILLGENNKDIGDLLPFRCETYVYRKQLRADIKMLRSLRKRKIDVLIDMTDNPSATSSIMTAMIGAKYSIGIEKENAESYNVLVERLDRGTVHISRRIAELLRPFGIDPSGVDLRPTLIGAPTKVPGRIALNISGKPTRYLRPEVNAELAKLLASDDNCNEVLVFSTPSDAADAAKVVALASDDKVQAAPMTKSFAEFARMIATCEYIVTPDTSVVHLGSAFNTPMVVWYDAAPPTLHHWTPVGVPYEMLVKAPSISLIAEQIYAKFQLLIRKMQPVREEVTA